MARPRLRPNLLADPPVMEWPAFLASMSWRQGEHVSCIGPTGTGKTTLALELLNHRAETSRRWWSTVVCTKPRDEIMARLVRRTDWSLVRSWPPPWGTRRAVLWPEWRTKDDDARQAREVRSAMHDIFARGNTALLVDELAYACRKLGLADDLKDWWQQGRSLGLTLVGCTQRPAWVPLDLYSQATHLFFWQTNDEQDLRRIGGVGAFASGQIRDQVARLAPHQVLYANVRTMTMVRTTAERKVTRP